MSRYKYLQFRWETKKPTTSHTQTIKTLLMLKVEDFIMLALATMVLVVEMLDVTRVKLMIEVSEIKREVSEVKKVVIEVRRV